MIDQHAASFTLDTPFRSEKLMQKTRIYDNRQEYKIDGQGWSKMDRTELRENAS